MDKAEQLSTHAHKCSGWGRTKIREPACRIQARGAPFSICPLICKTRVWKYLRRGVVRKMKNKTPYTDFLAQYLARPARY